MFVGREAELAAVDSALSADSGAIMIYGKRKVGKTTLIKQAIFNREEKYVYFECAADTMAANVQRFSEELARCGILPVTLGFSGFTAVFDYLNSLPYKLTVVIDEYPYLKEFTPPKAVDSEFQGIVDNRLGNIHLILSGSHVGMMKDLLDEGNALYGRFSCVIKLRELNYIKCADFYPGLSVYEKLSFYGVFGGSPYTNGFINPEKTLKENIISTILNENSALSFYASHMLISDFAKSTNAERILSSLGNGKKRYSEIEADLRMEKNGNLSKQLKVLEDIDLISHVYPINRQSDSKKSTYSINDNLLRFYYCFVYENRSALQILGPDEFYSAFIENKLGDFLARRFEETGRAFFSELARAGRLHGIRNIGTYYYDDPANRKNGEFDIALDFGNSVTVIEAKFLKCPMTLTMQHHEAGQIHKISDLKLMDTGFLSVNGFEEKEEGFLYFSGEDMFSV